MYSSKILLVYAKGSVERDASINVYSISLAERRNDLERAFLFLCNVDKVFHKSWLVTESISLGIICVGVVIKMYRVSWNLGAYCGQNIEVFSSLFLNPGIPVEDRVNIFINSFGSIQETTMVRLHFSPASAEQYWWSVILPNRGSEMESGLSYIFLNECVSMFCRQYQII